jgi:PKD repeat protein
LFIGLGIGFIAAPAKTVEKVEVHTYSTTNTVTATVTRMETLTETKTLTETLYRVSATTETVMIGYKPPIPKADAPLKILSLRCWKKDDNAYIYAELQNTGSRNLDYVKLGIILLDVDDRIVYVGDSFSQIEILLPGQKTPVFELQPNTPYERCHVFVESWEETGEQPYREFEVRDVNSFVDKYGFLHVVGKVVNVGVRTAEEVEVVVTFYDSEGNIVSSERESVTPSELKPGSYGSFDASTFIGVDKIGHWSIQVQCSSYR